MSGRAIAKSLSLSTSTISKYLKQLEPAPWPLPEPGAEAFLAKVLEKKKAPAPSTRIEPDWEQVHRELQSHKGVTLRAGSHVSAPAYGDSNGFWGNAR